MAASTFNIDLTNAKVLALKTEAVPAYVYERKDVEGKSSPDWVATEEQKRDSEGRLLWKFTALVMDATEVPQTLTLEFPADTQFKTEIMVPVEIKGFRVQISSFGSSTTVKYFADGMTSKLSAAPKMSVSGDK